MDGTNIYANLLRYQLAGIVVCQAMNIERSFESSKTSDSANIYSVLHPAPIEQV